MRKPRPWHRKKNDCWYVTYEGRQIRLTDPGGTQEDAWAAYYRRCPVRPGKPVEPFEGTTASEVCEFFVGCMEVYASPEIHEYHRKRLIPFARQLGAFPAAMFEEATVRRWIRHKGWNPSQARGMLISVHRAFANALRQGLIPTNPIARMRIPPNPVVSHEVSDRDAEALIAAADPEARDLLEVLRMTGCRPSEAARVTAADLELGSRRWALEKHRMSHRDPRPRYVYLANHPEAITRRRAERWKEGPIFRDREGRPWTIRSMGEMLDPLRRGLGLPVTVTIHSFRRAYISRAIDHGVDVASIAALLGLIKLDYLLHLADLRDRLPMMLEAARLARPEDWSKPQGGTDPKG
jgi:integrase